MFQKHNLHNSSPDGEARQPLSEQRIITPGVLPNPTPSLVSPSPLLARSTEVTAEPSSLPRTPTQNIDSEHALRPVPTRLSFGALPPPPTAVSEPTASDEQPPPVVFSPPRRSSRARTVRQLYDADSGSYKPPASVPEDV